MAWVVPSWFSTRDLPPHGELDLPDGLYLVVTPTVSPAGLMPSSQHQSVAPNPLLPANCGCMQLRNTHRLAGTASKSPYPSKNVKNKIKNNKIIKN